MSEIHRFSDDSVVESLFYAYGSDFLSRRVQQYQQMVEANNIGSEGVMPWLQQYHENHTTPRAEIAWLLTSRSVYGALTIDELLGEKPPSVRMVYVPSGEERTHAAEVRVAAVNSVLYDELNRFTTQRPFVVDETEFKKSILDSYTRNVTEFGVRHAEAGMPYNDRLDPDSTFMHNGELFTFIPEDDFAFSAGSYEELPQIDPSQFMQEMARAELASLRAEAIAASLQHAWRIDGPQIDTYDPLERLLSA